MIRSPDPSLPRAPYDPDKVSAWEQELLRQEEFCEKYNWDRLARALYESHGLVFEHEEWVKAEPYSQRNWEGDGA